MRKLYAVTSFSVFALGLFAPMGAYAAAVCPPSPIPAASPPTGRLLASQCAQCHGTNGQGGVENLAGRSANELYGDIMEIRNQSGSNSVMAWQLKGYTDAQLCEIAQYFSTLQNTSSGQQVSNSGAQSAGSGRQRTGSDD